MRESVSEAWKRETFCHRYDEERREIEEEEEERRQEKKTTRSTIKTEKLGRAHRHRGLLRSRKRKKILSRINTRQRQERQERERDSFGGENVTGEGG